MVWNYIFKLVKVPGGRKNSTLVLPPIVLRPYQQQCLDACLGALEAGYTRLGVSLPTGSGKTTVFVSLLSRIAPPSTNEKATRSIIVVNSVELARQSAAQVARMFPEWTVEIEQGNKHVASGFADVTIATYQTLNREQRLLKFEPSTIKAVIVDEAHHAAAKSYRALLSRFHVGIKHPDPGVKQDSPTHEIPIIGFSATFGRHDGLALGSVFERIVYHRDFLEMIKEQWLCDVRFTGVRVKLNLANVTINGRNGDFNATSLAQVVNTSTMNDLVVKTWIDRAATRKSTLVFCVNIGHVQALTQAFRKYGIDAKYIFSDTPPTDRKTLVEDFKKGVFPVLVNCAILTEGADIPNIDCVFVARPTRSRNLFAQMIGRGMRLSPETGKEYCRIIDFVDSDAKGVISVPSLFGLNPSEFDFHDETPESLGKRAAECEQLDLLRSSKDSTVISIPEPTSVKYIDYHNPFEAVNDNEKLLHIYSLSPLAWVACGDDVYVLELLKKGFVRIEPDESRTRFVARFTPRSGSNPTEGSPYRSSRSFLSADDLNKVVSGADNYVLNLLFRNTPTAGLYRTAKWRLSPASDAQKIVIEKRWLKSGSKMSVEKEQDFLEKLTKGRAATMITLMKHGALGRIKKHVKAMQKSKDTAMQNEREAREGMKGWPSAIGSSSGNVSHVANFESNGETANEL